MKWISVKDRLPTIQDDYLCYIESFEDSEYCDGWNNHIEIVNYDKFIKETLYEENKIIHILSSDMDFEINSSGYTSHKVTHWMPLPENPKVKE